MVHGFAELLGRKQGRVDAAARGFFQAVYPGLHRRVQGVLRRHPSGYAYLLNFVLRRSQTMQAQHAQGQHTQAGQMR